MVANKTAVQKWVLTGAILLALVGRVGPVIAETGLQEIGLQEIVVTARKRAEPLQDVPISVSVVSSDALINESAVRLEDALSSLPNVSFEAFDLADTNISIRGVSSSTDNFGVEPSVGVYIDEVYVARPTAFDQTALDVDRIEVLRGPQGTLFGRNTVGGVISIVTAKPSPEWSGSSDLSYGRDSLVQMRGSLSGPISDTAGFRLSASRVTQDGWFRELTPGLPDFGGEDAWAVRAKLLLKPIDDLEVIASFSSSRDHGVPGNYVVTSGPLAALNTGEADAIATNTPSSETRRFWLASLTANLTLAGHLLTSISGYQNSHYDSFTDRDFTAMDILATGVHEKFDVFSEELRLTSTFQSALSYIVGLYDSNMHLKGNDIAHFGSDLPIYLGVGPVPGYEEGLVTSSGLEQKAYAGFASLTYKASERISLAGGLRYTEERKTLDYSQAVTRFFVAPGVPIGLIDGFAQDVVPERQDYAHGVLAGDATASYHWREGVQNYFRFARGYKAGGFDTNVSASANPGSRAFKPEYVSSYEFGLKSLLLHDRLKLNGAVFYMDYKDKQEVLFNGTDYVTNNAAAAEVKGGELELSVAAAKGLLLSAGLGYSDARYGMFIDRLGGTNYSGNRLPLAPLWSGSTAAQYTVPVHAEWNAFLRGDLAFRSFNFTTVDNNPSFAQEAHEVVNARLGIEREDRSFGIYAWGHNLTDARYTLTGFGFLGNTFTQRNRPTMWGVEIRGGF